jgi:hypothetical protein
MPSLSPRIVLAQVAKAAPDRAPTQAGRKRRVLVNPTIQEIKLKIKSTYSSMCLHCILEPNTTLLYRIESRQDQCLWLAKVRGEIREVDED